MVSLSQHDLAIEQSFPDPHFRDLVERCLVGIYVIQDDRYVYVNPQYAETLGYERAELLTLPSSLDVIHPDDRGVVSRKVRNRLVGAVKNERYSVRMLKRSGTVIEVELLGFATMLNGRPAIAGSMVDVSPQRRAEEQMRLFEHTVQSSHELISITDLNDRFTFVNDAFLAAYGYERDEIIGQHLSIIDSARTPLDTRRAIAVGAREGGWSGELYNRRRDGSEFPIALTTSQIRDTSGQVIGLVGIARDISEKVRAEEALRKSEEHYRSLIENASDAITILRADGTIEYNAPSVERLLGYKAEKSIGVNFYEFVHPDDVTRARDAVQRAAVSTSTIDPVEFRLRHRDSTWRTVETIGRRIDDENGNVRILANCRDITDRKLAELRAEYQAFHDTLTDLPNRALFTDRVSQAVLLARRSSKRLAVLFLDLDHFKYINDTLGHSAGDALLHQVSARLRDALRQADTVARLGGDEFTILVPQIFDEKQIERVASKVLEVLAEPFVVHDRELFVTASIGIAVFPDDGDDVETLLKNSDSAMYRAKDLGRNNFQFYTPLVQRRAEDRLSIENALRHALERDELELYYQLQVRVSDGEVTGAEALIRWNRNGRVVSPAAFIPIAEETGLIVPIGDWVIRTACKHAKLRQMQNRPAFPFAVNLSARQLQHASLMSSIERALNESGLDPSCLELEVTETVAMQNLDLAVAVLNQIRARGIHIAMDDFGTGYSSLNAVKLLPFGSLKIDQTLVHGIVEQPRTSAIVRAVIEMAHALDLKVVAEGIENDEQLDALHALGCDAAQGYLFGRPAPLSQLDGMIHAAMGRAKRSER